MDPADARRPRDSPKTGPGASHGTGTHRSGTSIHSPFHPEMKHTSQQLGDFTTTARVIPISILAIAIGFVSTWVAWALLRLIGFFTNLFYYGRIGDNLVSPAGNHLGWFAV